MQMMSVARRRWRAGIAAGALVGAALALSSCGEALPVFYNPFHPWISAPANPSNPCPEGQSRVDPGVCASPRGEAL